MKYLKLIFSVFLVVHVTSCTPDEDDPVLVPIENKYTVDGCSTLYQFVEDIEFGVDSVCVHGEGAESSDVLIAGFCVEKVDYSMWSPIVNFQNTSVGMESSSFDFGDGNVLTSVTGGSIISHIYTQPGTYSVKLTVEGADGIADSVTQEIIVHEITICYLPNTFTPNGDGVNDTFSSICTGIADFSLAVFSPDSLCYFSTNPNEGWDGTNAKRIECPEGLYRVEIAYTTLFDELVEECAVLNLARQSSSIGVNAVLSDQLDPYAGVLTHSNDPLLNLN